MKALADAGVTVVAAGGKIGDLALHYLNKYKILAIRIPSKWETRRLCRTVGATILPKFVRPTQEELGFCDSVFVDELGDTPVIIFRWVRGNVRSTNGTRGLVPCQHSVYLPHSCAT